MREREKTKEIHLFVALTSRDDDDFFAHFLFAKQTDFLIEKDRVRTIKR